MAQEGTLSGLHDDDDEPILDPETGGSLDPNDDDNDELLHPKIKEKTQEEEEEDDNLLDDTLDDKLKNTVVTGVEQFLSQFGIQGGMIEFESVDGQESEKKHFDNLTPQEQFNVMMDLANSGATPIEQKYDLDKDEIGLLNMLREQNRPINEVIEEMAANKVEEMLALKDVVSVDFGSMSTDALYTKWIKDANPEATDEEIFSELATAKEGKFFNTSVERIRNEFISDQNNEINRRKDLENKEYTENLENDRKLIVESVADMDNVMGFPISNDGKNDILEKILELGQNGDSLFMEEVFSDPKALFKAAFLYYKGEEYINSLEEYYRKERTKSYKQGKSDAIDGMPSRPINGSKATLYTKKDDLIKVKTENFDTPPVRKREIISMSSLHDDEE